MTRTDGEHELVLGNKQLLSAFFVVVILLGVFFTMGYFVGKNTATSGFNAGSTSVAGARSDAGGKTADSANAALSTPAPESTTPANDPNAGSSSAPPPVAESAPPHQAPSETKKPTSPPERVAAQEAPTEIAKPGGEQLYLQVFALRRPDADNEVKMLKERGFPALLGESSKPGIYRVLVGPFKTSGEMGRTKAELKAKGIESIVLK